MEVFQMKNIKILPLVLLLPIIAACLFSCKNSPSEETSEIASEETTARPTKPYFTVNISENADFVAGDILISSKNPDADYTVESFAEIDCESIRLFSRSEKDSCWIIKIETKTRSATVEAIKKLAYRSDLNYAEPNFLLSPD